MSSPQSSGINSQSRAAKKPAPIHRLSGKFRAIGTVVLAIGAVATLLGMWWGPALFFPGAVVLLLGWWFEDESSSMRPSE